MRRRRSRSSSSRGVVSSSSRHSGCPPLTKASPLLGLGVHTIGGGGGLPLAARQRICIYELIVPLITLKKHVRKLQVSVILLHHFLSGDQGCCKVAKSCCLS